jgi:hypothetical protein
MRLEPGSALNRGASFAGSLANKWAAAWIGGYALVLLPKA